MVLTFVQGSPPDIAILQKHRSSSQERLEFLG